MNCKMCKNKGCVLEGRERELDHDCICYEGKTNADKIRSMTDEELAEFIMDVQGDVANYYCGNYMSEPSFPTKKEAWIEWLRKGA